jgi:hypothetical protein
MPKNHGKANKERKRAEAQVRQEAYGKLSPLEKIKQLDIMFGAGLGAKRQRARLTLEAESQEQKVKLPTTKNKLKD